MAGGRVAWVLNLDAEFELMDPGHARSSRLRAEIRDRARWLVPVIRRGCGHDVVWIDEGHAVGWPPPACGDCWCPTPGALKTLRRAGIPGPEAPPIDVLRRVNHRGFAAGLGVEDDGLRLPGAGYEATLSGCLARMAAAPSRRWVLKRPFGFSGRMRKVVVPDRLDRAARTWIEASMSGYGRGLQVEPLVERIRDFALHGRLERDGTVSRGRLVALRCDDRGRFVGVRPADDGELPSADEARFAATFARVADALGGVGYFGPFGIDGFAWRDDRGSRRFHPLSEINARYSMGWWTGMAPRPA